MRIVRRLDPFVQKISRRLRVADHRFVRDCLLGMSKCGSTMLTEIGRGLKERQSLQQTEKRLSRMAGSPHFDDELLRSNYLSAVGRLTAEHLPIVAVDLSEIAKRYGRAMEGLCMVRDGSSSRPRLTTGKKRRRKKGRCGGGKSRTEVSAEIVPGYWLFEADATHPDQHHVLPLLTEVWTTETPDFKSQNDVVERWLRYLVPSVAPSATWLFDRGFDSEFHLRTLLDLKLHFVVRMTGARNVEFADGPRLMHKLAEGLTLPHWTLARTRVGGSRDLDHAVQFTFIPVHLPGVDHTFGLVVARLGRYDPVMLLCWRVPKDKGEAASFIRAYLRRWSVEDGARAMKQLVGIEDVRVQSLRAVARLVRLAGMMLGWLCLLVLFAHRTVASLLARAKTVGKPPLFLVYRLLGGLRQPA